MVAEMKKVLTAMALSCLPALGFGAAYDEDQASFYTSGGEVDDVLNFIDEMVCIVNNARLEAFVNDGIYRARIYGDTCETESENSRSADSAAPRDSKTGGAPDPRTSEPQEPLDIIIRVTRADAESPVLSHGWFEVLAEGSDSGLPEGAGFNVYTNIVQTGSVSEDSPNGERVMRYAIEANEVLAAILPPEIPRKESTIGLGYIEARGKTLRYKQNLFEDVSSVVAESGENGEANGIFEHTSWVGDGEEYRPVVQEKAFGVDANNRVLCTQLRQVEGLDYRGGDPDTFEPARTDFTRYPDDGITDEEICFSTDIANAFREVWSYGVYDGSGDRFELTNLQFPLKALANEGTANEREVSAYADYFGVSVGVESLPYVTDSLLFEREDMIAAEGQTKPTYTLRPRNVRLEKDFREYASLSSLEGLVLGFDPTNIIDWSDELSLLSPAFSDTSVYAEYQGSFDAESQTFLFTQGITFYPNYASETLETPISFTVSDWLNTMRRNDVQLDNEDGSEYAQLRVFSHDTNRNYVIDDKAMNNPNDGSAPESSDDPSSGIWSRATTVVRDFSEIAEGLKCLVECPTSQLLRNTYTDVLAKALAADEGPISSASPSPYAGAVPYVTERQTVSVNICGDGRTDPECFVDWDYEVGDWADGFIAREITDYSLVDGEVTENGEILSHGVADQIREMMELNRVSYAPNLLEGATAEVRGIFSTNNLDLSWGLQSGPLVLASDLDELECPKQTDSTEYIDSPPPDFTAAEAQETRYCVEKLLYESDLTTYRLIVEVQPSFDVFDSGGNPFVFEHPKEMSYDVPDDESIFGEDAGKKLRLTYYGFGALTGIPQHLVDIRTGESLGQYFDGEWQENYRYLPRFTMPDGAEVTDTATGLRYRVKALAGLDNLSLQPEARGSISYSSSDEESLFDSVLVDVGPTGAAENFIGDIPAKSDMINGGEPAVVSGEILFDPSGS